jgi:hypothetical protein
MNELLQALAEGGATIPQMTAQIKNLAERLKAALADGGEGTLDEQSVWDFMSAVKGLDGAVKGLDQAIDNVHSKFFPAKVSMTP